MGKAIFFRLNELCRLPVGWDGYDAPPVEFGTVNFPLDMMKFVCDSASPVSSTVHGVNGVLDVRRLITVPATPKLPLSPVVRQIAHKKS